MRQTWRLALAAVSLIVLSGCLQLQRVVTVKPDGSGTIRERVVLKSQMAIMMISLAKQMKGEGKKKDEGIFDEGELREKASTMGEGVTYLSGKKLPQEEGEGYEVVYAFEEINKVLMSDTPDIQGLGDVQPN
ncbi:MAG: hypothetical protein ACRDGA_13795, partial [Bacteroidota bacterium]